MYHIDDNFPSQEKFVKSITTGNICLIICETTPDIHKSQPNGSNICEWIYENCS